MKKIEIKPTPVYYAVSGDNFEYKRFIKKAKKRTKIVSFCCATCLIKIYC